MISEQEQRERERFNIHTRVPRNEDIIQRTLSNLNKVRHSNFFITINTNYKLTPDDKEYQPDHDDLLGQAYFETFRKVARIAPGDLLPGDSPLGKVIKWDKAIEHNTGTNVMLDILADYPRHKVYIEEGTDRRGGRWHIHAVMIIRHKTYIQLSPAAIQREFLAQCQLIPFLQTRIRGVYCHVKSFNSIENYIDYASKNYAVIGTNPTNNPERYNPKKDLFDGWDYNSYVTAYHNAQSLTAAYNDRAESGAP